MNVNENSQFWLDTGVRGYVTRIYPGVDNASFYAVVSPLLPKRKKDMPEEFMGTVMAWSSDDGGWGVADAFTTPNIQEAIDYVNQSLLDLGCDPGHYD